MSSASRQSRRSEGGTAAKPPLSAVEEWFSGRGWSPFAFQREVWSAYRAGESGLIHAATGTGKTYAAWFAPIIEWIEEPEPAGPGPKVIWLTPLRALVADTARSLAEPLCDLAIPWTLETRTGDTPASVKARQKKRLPDALVTTPESLTLLLTLPNCRELFHGLRAVVADEWHELIGSKRGVLAELALARLRAFSPGVRIWGLSATLGNLDTALEILLGAGRAGRIVSGLDGKDVIVDTILPGGRRAGSEGRLLWSGQLGLKLLPEVLRSIEESRTSLVFTNSRTRTELWHQAILAARPEWGGSVGIHHSSLDRDERDVVEAGLKEGRLKCVVCTSSLDLGVDFKSVDRVIQIGSPRGVARLVQRAGRSGHGPGLASRVTCVPVSGLELVEIAAARDAALMGDMEERWPCRKPMDVLVQHIVTAALGGGFDPDELFSELKGTKAYASLDEEEWRWALHFVARGGNALYAYPEYRRLTWENDRYTVTDQAVARRHRMSVGTIVSDASMTVALTSGRSLGTIEESFVARLQPGDRFAFAGQALELVKVREMTAWVRTAATTDGLVPRWFGSRMPLSRRLAEAIREKIDEARRGVYSCPEMRAVRPILELQAMWSALPGKNEFLVERHASSEGWHLFFYPFEGRFVHEGLAALFACRLARCTPASLTMASNDYGFEILSPKPLPLEQAMARGLLDPAGMKEDITAGLNSSEMARRAFREIARVTGLVFQGYPGRGKKVRQLQTSAGLFFDVFSRYDPGNLLLKQAREEAVEGRMEEERLRLALDRLAASTIVLRELRHPSPLAFPLMVDHLRDRMSSEKLADRVRSMQLTLEREADRSLGARNAG